MRKRPIAEGVRGKTLVVLGVALLVVLVGCGTAKSVSVTQDDSGSSVTVPERGTLQVSLVGNPSTGYSWTVTDDAGGILKQIGEPTVAPVDPNASPSGQAVGASQRQTFQFDAAKTGSGELKMEYKRSWETTVPPETTFTLDVTVE